MIKTIKNLISLFLFALLFAGCGDGAHENAGDDLFAQDEDGDGSKNINDNADPSLTVSFLIVHPSSEGIRLKVGEAGQPSVTVVMADGSVYPRVTQLFRINQTWGRVFWAIADHAVASVSENGRVMGSSPGQTRVHVYFLGKSGSIPVVVEPRPGHVPAGQPPPPPLEGNESEEPGDPNDAFISDDDETRVTYGRGAGFGQDGYPQNISGSPGDGGLLSLGSGGSILIHFRGYVIVDGQGTDFTIFENPLGPNFFAERAQVLVSEDGENFIAFPCDGFDEDGNGEYTGCAGAFPLGDVNQPRNPLVSGGDVFDLHDVGLEEARYVLIEDLNTCVAGDFVFPVCLAGGKQGFDLDAVAIVNGRMNEE